VLRYIEQYSRRYNPTVDGNHIESVHNVAISLYVKYSMPEELRQFIKRHKTLYLEMEKSKTQTVTHFNVQYALRLCKQSGK
jgi:hypothetical protein